LSKLLWKLLPPGECLPRIAGFPPLIAQLLYNRGIVDPSQFAPFFAMDERLMGDPFLLPDMHQAVHRLHRALLSGENIAVYGDFDADGITSTVLLVQGLSGLGGRVIPYIPHRIDEGHGLNNAALEGLRKQGVTLTITVDCGISTVDEVIHAQQMGQEVIITDHHSVSGAIPPAVAVIDPKRADSAYPYPQLAGVGVAFKLLQAIQGNWRETLDLVALGTVADMVPLVGENRYLVKRGLELLNETKRPGLKEMISRARLKPGGIDVEGISWALGPRLNSASRVDHAIIGYNLLMNDSPEEASQIAQVLEERNAERQRLTNEVLVKAREQALSLGADSPLLMLEDRDYSAGIAGIVAGRLVDEFYRPVIVLEMGEEASWGSGRSIPEFDLVAALGECRDLLSRFGGYPLAAGFTVPNENLDLLRQRLLEMTAAQFDGLDLRPHLLIDAEVPLSFFEGEVFNLIQRLAPFGAGNPVPTFLSRKVQLVDCHQVGSNGGHLRLKLRHGNTIWAGVGFDLGSSLNEVAPYLDIVYNLVVDRWGGQEMLQLNILDFAPSLSDSL
jgi:single-stranded-DNA-specific exonuclease